MRGRHLLPRLDGGGGSPSATGRLRRTIHLDDGELFGEMADGDETDVDRAVRAARRAFDE